MRGGKAALLETAEPPPGWPGRSRWDHAHCLGLV